MARLGERVELEPPARVRDRRLDVSGLGPLERHLFEAGAELAVQRLSLRDLPVIELRAVA